MIIRKWGYYGDSWRVVEQRRNYRGEIEYLIPGSEYEVSEEYFDAIEPFETSEPDYTPKPSQPVDVSGSGVMIRRFLTTSTATTSIRVAL